MIILHLGTVSIDTQSAVFFKGLYHFHQAVRGNVLLHRFRFLFWEPQQEFIQISDFLNISILLGH